MLSLRRIFVGLAALTDLVALGLVLVGLAYTLATEDKLGLVVAFAGVTLLARGLLSQSRTSR